MRQNIPAKFLHTSQRNMVINRHRARIQALKQARPVSTTVVPREYQRKVAGDFDENTKVIAVDFDGCLCTNKFPYIGDPIWDVINEAKDRQKNGACLVLWTCREGRLLNAALEACRGWGLMFNEVNCNPAFRIKMYGNDCRKIGADEYWDDRAIRKGANHAGS